MQKLYFISLSSSTSKNSSISLTKKQKKELEETGLGYSSIHEFRARESRNDPPSLFTTANICNEPF